jgi:GH15 family glucan-1,4-alpha-glucosidase
VVCPAWALRRLERSLASCGTAALFSEEFDVAERQLRGNLPQAFVHALALEACVRVPQQVPGTRDDGF